MKNIFASFFQCFYRHNVFIFQLFPLFPLIAFTKLLRGKYKENFILKEAKSDKNNFENASKFNAESDVSHFV